MSRAKLGLRWSIAFVFTGCVSLPEAPEPPAPIVGDASLAEGLSLDGGSAKPPVGEPYRGPQCGTPAPIASADAGNSFEPLPDAGDAFDGGAPPLPFDAAVLDPQPGLPPPTEPGQLVITELMIDPSAVSDTDGEWIELWNATSEALDLNGCTLDDGAKTPRVLEALVLEPDAIATLARSAALGFTPSAIVSLSLTNSADSVAIACDGVEIDRVAFAAGYPLSAGASLSLDPEAWAIADNDTPATWCAARAVFAGDRGTPGAPNESCAPPSDAGTP